MADSSAAATRTRRRLALGGGIKSPLKRELFVLTLPIFIETLLVMSLGAMDTFMLSRYSDEAVASVGLANQVVTFAFIIFEVINLATAVLCSQCLGAGSRRKMERVAGVSIVINLLLGLLVSALLALWDREILSAMGLEGHMLDLGCSYMKIVGAFAFVQGVSLTISAILRSNNRAFYPMAVILVVNILNILGNYALIFGKFGMPAMGVAGAGVATAVSRSVALVILAVILSRTVLPRFPVEIFRRWPGEEVRNLMKIGLPSAGEQFSYSCSQLVIAFFITSLGMEALATRTYCVNIIMFVYLFSIAISHGGAISIGHLVGASKVNGAFVMGKYVCRSALRITLGLSILTALASSWIMPMLTDNPTIVSLGIAILWIDVVLEIGRPVNIFATNALQAAGDVNFPFIVGVVFMWSIAVLGAYFVGFTLGFGLLGIWWMFALDEIVRGIVFWRRWKSDKWRGKAFVTAAPATA